MANGRYKTLHTIYNLINFIRYFFKSVKCSNLSIFSKSSFFPIKNPDTRKKKGTAHGTIVIYRLFMKGI